MLHVARASSISLVCGAAFVAACSGATDGGSEPLGSRAETQTVAQVNIDRSRSATGDSAQALAHFVATTRPAGGADTSQEALELAGLSQPVPEVGECNNPLAYPVAPLASLSELLLLEAGEVSIESDRAGTLALAPRAFPSISSLASGVVYTSRDRAADALPSNSRYSVRILGSENVPALLLEGVAPRELAQVTLGGVPLAQVEEIAAGAPADLTWAVGLPSDVVYVDLARVSSAQGYVRCSFSDGDGVGSIPADLVQPLIGEPLRVSVHRLRAVPLRGEENGADALTIKAVLRFDFELSHVVEFGD